MARARLNVAVLALGMLLALLLVAVGNASPTQRAALAVRQSAVDAGRVKSGVLAKNGKQTGCGVIMVTNKICVVSADCLEYRGAEVDWEVNYDIFISKGHNGLTGTWAVRKAVVHPQYDPATKANNIAVLGIQLTAKETWAMQIAISPDLWHTTVYSQLLLTNEDPANVTWDDPNIYVRDSPGGDTTCNELSPLYAANPGDYLCTQTITKPAIQNTATCFVPFPTVFVQIDGGLFQAGIHSYSVLTGGQSLCGYSDVRSYYTLLGNYIQFITEAMGRTAEFRSPNNATTPPKDPSYAIASIPATRDTSAVVLSGDPLSPKRGSGRPAAPTRVVSSESGRSTASGDVSDVSSRSDSSRSDSSSSRGSSDSSSNGGSGRGELSKRTTTIIAAICAVAGTLIAVVLGIYGYRWYRGHISRIHDPYRTPSVRDQLEDMFNNPDNQPPPPMYRAQDRPSTRAFRVVDGLASPFRTRPRTTDKK
ncbi:hypothetical protein H4R19_000300 [Coemansia spiralis]|nr:hypothetical protein H4R19_000300 [Coemansia spiralis]